MIALNQVNMAERSVGESKIVGADNGGVNIESQKTDGKKEKPKIQTFKMSRDTYAMAFKALHWESA